MSEKPKRAVPAVPKVATLPARATGLEMVDQVLAIGTYLRAQKAALGHGRFRAWAEDRANTGGLSYRTVRLYMTLAKRIEQTFAAAEWRGDKVTLHARTLRQLDVAARTPRGKVRPYIGGPAAIALPATKESH